MDEPPMTPELTLTVEPPLIRGPLALYPLFSTAPGAPTYLSGPEAERLGVLRIAEKPGGATVPELMVHNTGALPLLLLEGETLIGAKQNRTLDASVLVAAGTTIAVPVTCVEAGRWGAPRPSVRSARHAPTDLRRVKTSTIALPHRRRLKQSVVWDRVSRYQHELGAPSPTSALEDVVTLRSGDVSALVSGSRPLPEQCGVAVAISGRLRGLDCFDKPTTLAEYWDGLVAGYALDAVRAAGDPAPASPAVDALLMRVAAAARTTVPGEGLGTGATFVGDEVVGTELTWEGTKVHISAFVHDTGAPSGPTPTPSSQRRTPRSR